MARFFVCFGNLVFNRKEKDHILCFFPNALKGNNLRMISSGHLGDVAGGSGRVCFSVEHKPLIEMSLAQCWEDQLIPINQTGKPRFQRGISMPRFLPFLGRSHPGTGSADNQPLWPETLQSLPGLEQQRSMSCAPPSCCRHCL